MRDIDSTSPTSGHNADFLHDPLALSDRYSSLNSPFGLHMDESSG